MVSGERDGDGFLRGGTMEGSRVRGGERAKGEGGERKTSEGLRGEAAGDEAVACEAANEGGDVSVGTEG